MPDLDLLRQFDRYRRGADRRSARRYRRQLDRLDPEDGQAATVARFSEGLSRIALWVEATVDNLPIANLALSGKAAYAVSQLVRLTAVCAALLAAGVGVQLALGRSVNVLGALTAVGGNAWFGLAACILVIVAIRRVLFRLDDKGS